MLFQTCTHLFTWEVHTYDSWIGQVLLFLLNRSGYVVSECDLTKVVNLWSHWLKGDITVKESQQESKFCGQLRYNVLWKILAMKVHSIHWRQGGLDIVEELGQEQKRREKNYCLQWSWELACEKELGLFCDRLWGRTSTIAWKLQWGRFRMTGKVSVLLFRGGKDEQAREWTHHYRADDSTGCDQPQTAVVEGISA